MRPTMITRLCAALLLLCSVACDEDPESMDDESSGGESSGGDVEVSCDDAISCVDDACEEEAREWYSCSQSGECAGSKAGLDLASAYRACVAECVPCETEDSACLTQRGWVTDAGIACVQEPASEWCSSATQSCEDGHD